MAVKVLVVDDDPITRRLLRQLITRDLQGEVVEAANGLVALDIINREGADVVLLDLQMPGLDGVEALHTLRTWRHTRDLPVVVLTSETDEKTVKRCLALGIADYLAKPLKPVNAVERLAKVIATSKDAGLVR